MKFETVEPEPVSPPPVLKPPPEPIIEDEGETDDLEAWLIELALSSEFRRIVYKIKANKVHRKNNADLNRQLKKEIKVTNVVRQNYGNVMNEFKTKVKKIKNK